jgi:hypothetical protein
MIRLAVKEILADAPKSAFQATVGASTNIWWVSAAFVLVGRVSVLLVSV